MSSSIGKYEAGAGITIILPINRCAYLYLEVPFQVSCVTKLFDVFLIILFEQESFPQRSSNSVYQAQNGNI